MFLSFSYKGGVDEKSIASTNKKHVCSPDEKNRSFSKRAANVENYKDQCPDEIVKYCRNTTLPEKDKPYCDAINYLYSKEGYSATKLKNIGILRKEDITFVRTLEVLAGYSPLDKSEKYYLNAMLKYDFYKDVLNQFEKFAPECQEADNNRIINTLKKTLDKSRVCADQDCGKIKEGEDTFDTLTTQTINNIDVFADQLDKITREYAKKKSEIAATSAVATVADATLDFFGVVLSPFTFGASLSLDVVGTAAAGVEVATGIASIVNFYKENHLTNDKLKQLEKKHKDAAR